MRALGVGAAATGLPTAAAADRGESEFHAYSPGTGRYPNRLVVESDRIVTKYRFAVSDDVVEGEAADFSDIVYEDDGLGFLARGGVDDYWFAGEIERFSGADGVDVFVNGRRVADPTGEGAESAESASGDEGGGGSGDESEDRPECFSLEPLSYRDQSVVDFYGYEPDAGKKNSQQSTTPTGLEKPDTSRLFLYEGPDGLSLVMIHGSGETARGGAVSFRVEGVPDDAAWVVRDDGYEGATDEFAVENGTASADWAWGVGSRNDGGALGYLPDEFRLRIDPRFNEDAELDPFDKGGIQRWEVLSGDASDPEVRQVPMDRPLVLAVGEC
ncbi:hypothetical protein G9464_19910 [Halostella sp. JP-L12]|uniref:hypothetical protein n=1 Tax=Halostella TaxID=1843185 RepID=UPI0013CEB324|nr:MULTISPECIES: hypothetical protein [Halostella]NHN49837.1 hypothetical protein [Halostella sp. JP-L12]